MKKYVCLVVVILAVLCFCFFVDTKPAGRIFVAYYKPATYFKNNAVIPIHVGRAIEGEKFQNTDSKGNSLTSQEIKWLNSMMAGDNTGENISAKNRRFDILTLYYWWWKNPHKDKYVGIAGYRYFLSLNPNVNTTTGYVYLSEDQFLSALNLNDEYIKSIMSQYDAVTPHKISQNLYEEYKKYHIAHHLDLAVQILKQKYPQMAETADRIIYTKTDSVLSNFWILRTELAEEYLAFLFDILFEVEKQTDLEVKGLSLDQQRVYGFLAERLFAVFLDWKEKKDNIKILFTSVVKIKEVKNQEIKIRVGKGFG